MNIPRARHASVVLSDGRVLVTGGYHTSVLDSVELYDPVTDEWTLDEPLPMPTCDHAACLAGSQMIITGGLVGSAVVAVDIDETPLD
jgi:hypothetical protein